MDKFLKVNNTKKVIDYSDRYAITFGEVSILHVGGMEFGKGIRSEGFSVEELLKVKEQVGEKAEFISISDNLPKELRKDNEAGVLIIRCCDSDSIIPVSKNLAEKLFIEQTHIQYDNKYWDNRRSATLNKRARKNIVFGLDEIAHSDDYKQPSIKSFKNLPFLSKIRDYLVILLGDKAKYLNAEGNHYNHSKSGIGFHGDAERKIVICLSLGKSSILRYQWRLPGSSEHTLNPIDIKVNHGDIYIMSEKATGYDWKSRSKVRVVHAAGHENYINK